jgi:ABC-type phosphate transport system substrate-binding protein
MERLDFRRRRLLHALLSLGFGLSSTSALAAGEAIAVVVSSNSRQRGLSSDKLRRIFLALPTDDDDGHRFVPINLAQGSSVREHFDREVLNMSSEDAARYWIDQRLRGNKPPRSAASLDICRRAVQDMPGAISYLPLSAAGQLRILAVNGRAPSEAGYALR